ncbi:MAG: response regulator [Nocardioidaceae bacterium]
MTGHPTILVIEDNALNLKLVRDVLSHAGYRVVEARTGEDGVRLAGEEHPDLVLMDLQLPGIDGSEALRRLRQSGQSSVPVVAVTAFAMPEDRARALSDGFDAYLEKPLSVRVLPRQVARLLAGEGPDAD